jgi:acetyl-CoA acetyltransferase
MSTRSLAAIVGVGLQMSHTLPADQRYTARSLAAEAARLAIADAGLNLQDIDGAVNCMSTPGPRIRVIETDGFPRLLGLPINFYYNIGRGGSVGTLAITSAISLLENGLAKYVVIAIGANDRKRRRPGVSKIGVSAHAFGASTAVSFHSLLAARHMYEYGTTSEQLGMVTVQARRWAAVNPKAKMYRQPITIEDHQASPMVVDPYHLLDLCLMTDGGAAFVLTTVERARDLPRKPVYVRGFGFGEHASSMWWDKKNFTGFATETAKAQAFGLAGIEVKDIDLAQIYDCFTGEVVLQLEGYGFCGKGEGGPFVAAGSTGPGGTIPVNTYGGLLGAYHMSDLGGSVEGVTQLRGEAGERQVDGARTCLVTGLGGEIVEPICAISSALVLGAES